MKKTDSPASKTRIKLIEPFRSTMKPFFLPLVAGLLTFSLTARAELKWSTDLTTAIAQAKKEKKLIFGMKSS